MKTFASDEVVTNDKLEDEYILAQATPNLLPAATTHPFDRPSNYKTETRFFTAYLIPIWMDDLKSVHGEN